MQFSCLPGDAFIEAPTESFLDECTKDQLVKIADFYKVDVGDRRVKETVKANLKVNLFKMKVLVGGEVDPDAAGAVGFSVVVGELRCGVNFRAAE